MKKYTYIQILSDQNLKFYSINGRILCLTKHGLNLLKTKIFKLESLYDLEIRLKHSEQSSRALFNIFRSQILLRNRQRQKPWN